MAEVEDLQRAADHVRYGDIPDSAIRLRNGHLFDIFDDGTWAWDLETVASALGNLCRFNGHVRFYSVAEHAIRVSDWLQDRWPDNVGLHLLGLHHEDEESIVGDVVSPHKRHLVFSARGRILASLKGWSEFLRESAWHAFGLTWNDDMLAKLHEADAAVYALEADERPNVGESYLPRLAGELWLARHEALTRRLDRMHDHPIVAPINPI